VENLRLSLGCSEKGCSSYGMELLTAGGQAPEADMRRLKEFETKHSIDKKRQRK
jgi:hypothetical protein